MIQKGILILMGYDYVHAIRDLVTSPDTFVLITKNNTRFIGSEHLEELKEIMGDRLLISENSKEDIPSLVASGKYSTLLTLGWRKLINIDDFPKMENLINVHPALLPEYKGYHPVPYILLNEERVHGITAHRISNEMDAGDIILRKEFPITKFSTLQSLQYLANQVMPEFLQSLFALIRTGIREVFPNRDEDTKIRAPKRKPEDSELDLKDSVEEMFRKVKASDVDRFPAYFILNGEKVFIHLKREDSADRQTQFDI